MKVIQILLLTTLQFMLLSVSCEGPSANMNIDNQSNENIIAFLAIDRESGVPLYPDTSLPEILPLNQYDKRLVLKIAPKKQDYFSYSDAETVFEVSKTEKVCVYIISEDTISKYGWNDVRKNYRILKRYDISPVDKHGLNSGIAYPPTPEMANVQMHPPYEK